MSYVDEIFVLGCAASDEYFVNMTTFSFQWKMLSVSNYFHWKQKHLYIEKESISLFVSLLSHFWLIHFCPPTPALSTISRPLSSSMCSITPETANVGSSYNRMRGPGIGCWFSDRSNCSHWSLTLTFTLTSENLSLYTTLLLVLVLIHLDSNYCRTRCRQSQPRFMLSPLLLHPRLLGTFQSDIPLFTLTWPAKHSPNQGWESTHRLHLYPLGGVFYSP